MAQGSGRGQDRRARSGPAAPRTGGAGTPVDVEAALAAANARFDLLLRDSPVVIGETALLSDEVLFVSPNIEQMLGYRAEDLIGTSGWLLAHVHPDDVGAVVDLLQHLVALGEGAAEVQFRFPNASGEHRWVVARIRLTPGTDGAQATVLWYVSDVTERVVAEEQRRVADERARQAEHMERIGQLADRAAHNVNNLLTVIFANIDFIRIELDVGPSRGPEGEAAIVSYLAGIELAAARTANLARSLLTVGRSDRARPEVVHLDGVLADLAGLLSRTLGDRIDYSWDAPARLAPIFAKRDDIEQILLNLAANARDAMPDGGALAITFTDVPASRSPTTGAAVCITVTDTGTGMSPGVRARVFEPFFSTKPAGTGMGLGMASVYEAVAEGGGRIEIESEPGAGASIRVWFPATERAEPAATEPAAAADPRQGRGEVVLLVEDEEAVRDAARAMLHRHGYRVLAVHGPAVALRMCATPSRRIDLLLTDVVMPGMGGVELASHALALRPDLPVLLMSGYSADLAADGERLVPALPLLAKPFSSERLLHAVADALDAPARAS